jgi:hypothetical protein
MLDRRRLIILIPAIILIPILLGMIPLNMAHTLANSGPFVQGKQGCPKNHCPFHSLTAHHDLMAGIISSTTFVQVTEICQADSLNIIDPYPSNIFADSVPLRC